LRRSDAARAGWLRLVWEHHFSEELAHVGSQSREQSSALSRDAKDLPSPGMLRAANANEPAISLHAQEGRVERSRAQDMTVLGELLEEPHAPDRTRCGVVKDVDFPNPEPNLAVGGREHYVSRLRFT
jgi:hypothetical protein